jgi:hypothetical protein
MVVIGWVSHPQVAAEMNSSFPEEMRRSPPSLFLALTYELKSFADLRIVS